ncbi:MAG: hypothetical protein HOP29_10375 [Phycisphaerales bacterium]|nr:hypothetical protein [Phycisphaerales bacterium]
MAKQALACLCSTSGPGFSEQNPLVRKLILSRDYRCKPPDVSLYFYKRVLPGGHHTGVAGGLDLQSGSTRVITETSQWPIGWVLSWSDNPIPRLTNVTHWLEMEYKQTGARGLTVHCLWTCTGLPLDYRTPDEVIRDAAVSAERH